jgi:hypothetical protein
MLLGDKDWERLLERPADVVRGLVRGVVMQRGVELQELRDRNLAIRIANAINGARTVDGSGGSNTSSTH